MAWLLYNSLSSQFHSRANIDLPRIRKNQDIDCFQQQKLLCSMLQQLGKTDINNAWSASELLTVLQDHIMRKPVLLLLDNVGSAKQLDELLPVKWHSSSCLIITSRSKCMSSSRVWKVSSSATVHQFPVFVTKVIQHSLHASMVLLAIIRNPCCSCSCLRH
jgi:hypothetical protein